MKRYTITAALPYANGPIHIGHLAGVYIPADIFSRYMRFKGNDVAFICGSDEHGVPITIKADKEGCKPQEIVDKYNKIIKDSFASLGISFDFYSRTSNEIHHQTASEFFTKLYNENKFLIKETEQYYDNSKEQFLADRYILGTCPKCGEDNAYGDQCEKCGSTLSPEELINPRSAISGNPLVKKKTKHWYLPLNEYEEFIRKWIIEGHKNDWKPNVYGQVKSWIEDGLKPRAVTRDLDWGVKVPLQEAIGKVLYVWFDAPIGYISATKEWAKEVGKNWEDYWKDKNTTLIHFIGKDNIVFHCIIFPAMLKAYGGYILPENVPANEFLNLEGDKLSTSKNWAVWLNEYLEDFPNMQDALRYAIITNAPETKDSDFTWEDFMLKNNSELVGIYGNFVNRIVVLVNKYYDGKIPENIELTDKENEILSKVNLIIDKIEKNIEIYKFRDAMSEVMNIARLGNKYLADEEPWNKIKNLNSDIEVIKILFTSLQILAKLSIISEFFLPFSSNKLKKILNTSDLNIDVKNNFIINKGHKINKNELLFEKIEEEDIKKQIDKLNKSRG